MAEVILELDTKKIVIGSGQYKGNGKTLGYVDLNNPPKVAAMEISMILSRYHLSEELDNSECSINFESFKGIKPCNS